MTASTLTVASIQMVSAPDVPSNLATAARLVAQAAVLDGVVVPEPHLGVRHPVHVGKTSPRIGREFKQELAFGG